MRLIKFFKRIIIKVDFLKDKFSNFQKLKSGDIIWAKMPLSKKKMKNIEAGHQIRPYLIISKNKFYIYCFQSSSKTWNKAYNYQEYRINRFRYKITKDSFINLITIYKVPFWNIKSKYINLQDIDLKNIEKRLEILNSKYRFNISFKIDDGDIIKIKNQLYYVYASDNTNLYCLIIYQNKPSNKYERIKIDNYIFYTKFEKRVNFNRKEEIKIVNIAFTEEKEKIKKQMKESKRKKLKKS